MKNRYPFLYVWKIIGFNKFPTVPTAPIYELQRKKALKGLKEYHKTPEAQLVHGPNLEPAPIDNETMLPVLVGAG